MIFYTFNNINFHQLYNVLLYKVSNVLTTQRKTWQM